MSLFVNMNKSGGSSLTDTLIQTVNEGFAGQKRGLEVVKKTTFSPSNIGYKYNRCPRSWAMRFSGEYEWDQTKSDQSLSVMGHGTERHERIQDLVKDHPNIVEVEREIKHDDPPIRGFIDLVINHEGVEHPIEIKTTRTEAFDSRFRKQVGPAYQMYQLLSYMKIMGVDQGAFLYEDNNDKRLMVIPVYMDEVNRNAIDEAFEWMRTVKKFSDEGQLPARPWKQTSPNCAECPLFDACWAEEREDVKIKSMRVHTW